MIGFAGEQFLLISSLLVSDPKSSHEDDTFFVFSFVNDIVMTVTFWLNGTFKGCYAALVLINIQGMTPYRFHKECLKCLLPSRMKPNNK